MDIDQKAADARIEIDKLCDQQIRYALGLCNPSALALIDKTREDMKKVSDQIHAACQLGLKGLETWSEFWQGKNPELIRFWEPMMRSQGELFQAMFKNFLPAKRD